MVMGAQDFMELMDSEAIRHHMTFSMQEVHYQKPGGYKLKYAGLPVHVVPGLGGHAIIPKVIVEKIVHVTPDGKPRMDMNGPGIQSEIIERFDRRGSY
jgi:hypothetical protein